MTTMTKKRQIAAARRLIGNDVARAVRDFEELAHSTAIAASRCLEAALLAHRSAALPQNAGMELLDVLSEASRHASLSRVKIGIAHGMSREMSETHSIPFASDPECPPNTGGGIMSHEQRGVA